MQVLHLLPYLKKQLSKLWDKNMDVLSKGSFLISREVYQNMIDSK
jgi:hypothetical protein